LRWESINFEADTITIEHTVTEALIDGKRVTIADNRTKSKSSYRTLPLVPAVRAKLLAVQAEQETNRKLCGKSYNKADSEYIYTDALGNRIKPNYLTHAFPDFITKHGFKRMRFHDLRHSCASLLLANGVSLKEIQEWLGHSDFAITANIYAHLEFDSKLKSAEKMSWIGNTSLGSEAKTETSEPATLPPDFKQISSDIYALPDFMHSLIVSGVSPDVIQQWLKSEYYLESGKPYSESFKAFQSSVQA